MIENIEKKLATQCETGGIPKENNRQQQPKNAIFSSL